jgi:iron complex outermembrane receptor protein
VVWRIEENNGVIGMTRAIGISANVHWRTALLGCAALCALGGPAAAQAPARPAAQAPAPVDDQDPYADPAELDELVVVAARQQRGAVVGDIPPEIQLGPREIRALGASSVAELLDALSPQTGSSRGRGGGRPVMLVNGQRISSFAEVRDLPPEAIQRVDILPEEVALKYGYPANQRVVNLVLRRRFRALTTEAGVRVPTAGDRESFDATANVLRIQGDTRVQIDVKAARSTPLLESERDILRADGAAPFAVGGNVTAAELGDQIDPALSAEAGRPLTVVGIPANGLTLGAFAAAPVSTTDEGRYRTLLSGSNEASLNMVLSRPIAEGVGATVNARLEASETQSRLGLDAITLTAPAGNPFSPFARDVAVQRFSGLDPLTRTNDVLSGHLGLAVNGARSGWRWALTANADRTHTETLTERGLNVSALQAAIDAGLANPFAAFGPDLTTPRAPDQARSTVTSADVEAMLNGTLFKLPAGEATTTLTIGGETRNFESWSRRLGVTRTADLSRNIGRVQANFDAPLTRRGEFLSAIGDLSANVNVAAEKLSDFGTLTTLGAGLNWSPIDRLRFIASFTDEEGAPTIQQLGDPVIDTENARVFDFVTGQTVFVTRREGGNPDLLADSRQVLKLGVNFKPLRETDLTFRADYVRTKIRDVIASFPAATAEIREAFPERFYPHEVTGQPVFDLRPVNFARQDLEEVRWGFNYVRRLGPTRRPGQGPGGAGGGRPRAADDPAAPNAARAGQPPGAQTPAGEPPAAEGQTVGGQRGEGQRAEGGPGGGFGGRGSGGFGGGGIGRGGFGGGGALQLALFHTLRLQNEILIRPGVEVLDLLNGSAAGANGGQPRHEIEAQAGATRNGLGVRLVARWQSGTDVVGAPFGGQNLTFSDLTTVNARLFADIGLQPWARGKRWLRGTRATVSVDNLFDARIRVRDASGATPINYQPDLIDPLGRTVRVSLRKLFF